MIVNNQLFIQQILYLCFGTHQVVLPDCVGLEKKIDVYLDDEKIELPELQAVVCLNIDSWGAGVHLWGEIHFLSVDFGMRKNMLKKLI